MIIRPGSLDLRIKGEIHYALMDNFQNREERKMYKGDWTCSKCGAKIDALPFEPDPSRLAQLLCRDCHRTARQSFRR